MFQMSRVILITGVSTGIGADFVKIALGLHPDWKAFGISRTKPDFKHTNFTHYEVDLTDFQKVNKLVSKIQSANKIDTLINNAGSGWRGAIEQTTIHEAKQQLDLNVWALVNITNAVLPIMRSSKNGLILNVSSVAAQIDMGTIGYYSATKAFVDKLSNVLQLELREWNIKIATFSPGAVKTNFGHSMINIKSYGDKPYQKMYKKWADNFELMFSKSMTSTNAAAELLKIVEKNRTGKFYLGRRDKTYLNARRILGENIFSKLALRKFMKL